MNNNSVFTQEDIRILEARNKRGILSLFEKCLLKDLKRKPFKFNLTSPPPQAKG